MCRNFSFQTSQRICNFISKISQIILSRNQSGYFRMLEQYQASKEFSETLAVSLNDVAIDLYSVDELINHRLGSQWASLNHCGSTPFNWLSLFSIYIITGRHLHERHSHVREILHRHHLDESLLRWRWSWNQSRCASIDGKMQILEKMNLHGKDNY